MTDGIDRSDELLDMIADDQRRETLARNGQDPDDPGPAEPPDVDDHHAADDQHDDDENPSVLDALAINGADLDAEQFDPLEFAVDGLVPEGLGILVGPPKLGKSWLVGDIGLSVAGGGIALNTIRATKRPVLYLALEDGKRRLQSRSRLILRGQPIPNTSPSSPRPHPCRPWWR
jgi:hypothetical protein